MLQLVFILHCNRNCPLQLFLNRFPGMVELHLCLLITPKWLQGTTFPAEIEPFKLTSSCLSWQRIHIGKLETLFYSCSTKAQEGSSFSLTRCWVAMIKLLPAYSCGCWPSASLNVQVVIMLSMDIWTIWLLALSLLKCASCYYVKYVDMDHIVVKTVLRISSFWRIV